MKNESLKIFSRNAGGGKDKISPDGVVQFYLADIGEGIAECEILKWNVKEGDQVNEFDNLCQVQSDKATVDISSRYSGVVLKLHYKKGDIAKVGTPLVDIKLETDASSAPASTSKKTSTPPTPSPSSTILSTQGGTISDSQILASPATRHLARQNNIPLSSLKGTGRGGMITREDIMKVINSSGNVSPSSPSVKSSSPTPPISSKSSQGIPEDRSVPLTGYSRIMAKTMAATVSVPHFGLCDEIVVDNLIKVRQELKEMATKKGVKFSYMPLLIKAASLALKEFPMLNAHYDDKANILIHKGAHNIGVAVDSPNGLVVPNIKNVQNLSLLEIAQELNRLQEAALKSNVNKEDLVGGTFTFSNIGTIAGTYASPVLVLPEVVIGAIGKIQRLPRFDENDKVIPVNIMNISWSADHRVVDGATMASFSNLWKQFLENPHSMLLHSR